MDNSDFPVEDIFKDGLEISKKHLEEIVGLIAERERIFDENVKRIVDDQLKWGNKLLVISGNNFGLESENQSVIGIEREIMNLEREKRREDVTFWQDITKLRLMLAEALREEKSAERKASLLSGIDGTGAIFPDGNPGAAQDAPKTIYYIPMASNYLGRYSGSQKDK